MEMKTREQCGIAAEDFMVNRGYTYGGWHLAPPDATACDSGLVANPDQCQAAIKWLRRQNRQEERRKKRPLQLLQHQPLHPLGQCTGAMVAVARATPLRNN